jgi:AcrR family transcriptional regulator
MRPTARQPGDARLRLILTAERLLATEGDGVSDRTIVAEAEHHNKSAINYHFGSRAKLIEAIWDLHTRPVNEQRAKLLFLLPPEPECTTRQLVDAHLQPFVGEMLRYSPSYWARFNERRLVSMPIRFISEFAREIGERDDDPPMLVLAELLGRMERHLTQLTPDQAADRVALTVRFMISSLAAWERDSAATARSTEPLLGFALSIGDLAVAMLEQPGRPLPTAP